jgi:hypothetical protein
VLLFFLTGIICSQPDNSTQQLEFLRLSYKANKDSFAYGTFRFRFTRGSSASLADAESEVFSKAFELSGFYAFEGDNARYESVADPKVLAAATTRTGELRTSSLITSFRSLTNGKFTLRDNHQLNKEGAPLRHGTVMSSGTNAFYRSGSFDFPLYIGDNGNGGSEYDLFRHLTETKGGKLSLAELDMDSHLDGFNVCKFSCTWKDGRATYWIDLNRGSIPLRVVVHYNPNNTDAVFIFTDLLQMPNAGWLPRKKLHIIHNGKAAIVDRVVVTEFDTEKNPGPSTFQLDFPEPIRVLNSPEKVVYPPSKTWSLLKLPSPSSKGVRPAMQLPAPTPDLPGEAAPTRFWMMALVAAVVLFLALGFALILARQKPPAREV